jgi:hypothetical protein
MIDVRTFKGDKNTDWFSVMVVVSTILFILYAVYTIIKWTLNIIIICVAWLVAPLFDNDKNKKK